MIASVLLCSIICLAIAAHFLSVLSSSDLSEFCLHGPPGNPALTPLGSSFCTFRNFRILGNPCHHSRTVRLPYPQMSEIES